MMRAVILFGMLGWVGSLIWSAFNGLGIESAFPAAITSALVMGVIGLGAFSLLRTIVETVAGDRSEEADLEEIEALSKGLVPAISSRRGEEEVSVLSRAPGGAGGENPPQSGNTSGAIDVDDMANQSSGS